LISIVGYILIYAGFMELLHYISSQIIKGI
jgi:hypothetical protein